MRMSEIIRKKQLGEALSHEEIRYFLDGYVREEIPDYQASALVMAIWFMGMNMEETAELTLAMAESGAMIDLSPIQGIKVDKHSSGGVADTTTIAVGPLAASCGAKVAKMSGRGLSFSGGTLDKLESIPGFRVDQDMESFMKIVNTCGVSIIGQTADLVPADKKLYALRDVTSTVDSMALIAASIMSKKLASGGDKILLDVKWGSGAFMKRSDDALELAHIMVEIGRRAKRETRALVTDMNQPLGHAVGNALEVAEAIEILRGEREGDLKDLIMELSAHLLEMAQVCSSREEALRKLKESLDSGKALETLAHMIELHGGDPKVCEDTDLLPRASRVVPVCAEKSGWIQFMHTDEIGMAAVSIGAGRKRKEDQIDPAVGLWMEKRLGDEVQEGEVLAQCYVNDEGSLSEAVNRLKRAVIIGEKPPRAGKLISDIVE